MAEIAVSGAITVVTTVLPFLQKICSGRDRRNIRKVRRWLNTMIAYLKDTEGREDTAGLKDRVQRVQDLAYETQDAIEEFMYEVPEHFHHHWITIALHDIAHFFKDFLPLCRFSSRMADIKKEVDDIGDFDTIRFCPSQVASSSTTAGEVSGTYNSFSRNDHHVLVGITKRVDVLLDRVSMGDQPRYLRDIVIPVIGDPGSGKSTVIHEVFEMVKNSFECKAWVSVTPFCKDFLEKLCQELELPFDPGRHNKRSLQFHLQQKTYILVFNVLRSSSASLGGEKTRGLSLHNCPLSMLQGTDLSYVRTFSMFGRDKFSESMANELFKNFKLMKNLNLENAALQHFPKEVVNLTLLRYLSLRSTKIDSVPKSIKKLQNLEFLDLRNTRITKLPKEIFGLPKLLCLFVGCPNAVVGAQVYPGIECSTSLQKLSLIKANYEEKSIVKELGNLTDLRKLGITELKEIEGKDLCASIEKMKHLYSLSVSSASKEAYLDLKDMKESPRLLQKLSLGGRLKEIPAWVGKLYNLYKIELNWSKLQDSPLEALHALPSLKELHLNAAYTGEFLEFIAQPFLELRILEVEQCNQLYQVVILEQALPKLQKLIIKNCDRLAMVHITMNMLSQLEEVRVPQDCVRLIEE